MDLGLLGEFLEERVGDGCVEGRGWGEGDVRGLWGGGVHKIEDTPECGIGERASCETHVSEARHGAPRFLGVEERAGGFER